MNLREAAQQALEALEAHADFGIKSYKAITALRAALAEPTSQESRQVEPVAWMWRFEHDDGAAFTTKKPEASIRDGVKFVPLYTAPPKRKPLTNEQIFEFADTYLYDGGMNYGVLDFAEAIERAYGIGGGE